jgi:predicted metal-dependent peptidase
MMSAGLHHKIAVARLWAAARQPYLASALFAPTVIVDSDCDTVAVDRGWNLHADPARIERIPIDDLGPLLLHLVSHLVRDHADRADRSGVEADNQRAWWNRCADAEINDDLARIGIYPVVVPDLPPDLHQDTGGLVETYYRGEAIGMRRWDCGSGCDNGDRSWDRNGLDHQQRELLCIGVADEIQRSHGREPGTIPGGWLRWAEAVLPSRVDWRRVLAAEIRRELASVSGQVDYTYRRPSRRSEVVGDVVLASLHRPTPDVAIVCDTSGSMHDELLSRALAEVEGVLTRAGLRRGGVRVLAVDTNVHAVRRVTRSSDVVLAGGGGTDMGAGIRAATALRPRPAIIIVLTDGFTPWPATRPRNTKVIVGILDQPGWSAVPPPDWARAVRIDPTGGAFS